MWFQHELESEAAYQHADTWSGAASAQFLGVLAVPVLARVFNANDFGVFAMFFLGSQLLGTCFAARYEQAIMVAEERHVSALTALCVSLAIVSALASVLVLTLFARELDLIFNTSLGLAWPLTSIAAFFVSITTTFTMVASREQYYGGISVSRFCKAMVAILIQAALGLTILPNAWGLIIGETVASGVAPPCSCPRVDGPICPVFVSIFSISGSEGPSCWLPNDISPFQNSACRTF